MRRRNERKPDAPVVVSQALERIVDQMVAQGDAKAYLCSLRLPRQFSEDMVQANDIFKKTQSDFCKSIMRGTGSTPRYIAVRTDNETNPEYAFCLFTRPNAMLDPTAYAEKGCEIANGKSGHAGWGRGRLDVVELFKDAPRFKIAQPLHIDKENADEILPRLQEHLNGKKTATAHQRTLFVSKCQ